MPEPRFEGKDTPKICLGVGDAGAAEGGPRRIKQLGVDYVLSGGGPIPWEEARLKEQVDRLKNDGLTLGNLMIAGFNNAIYARPGRDEEIDKVIQSIKAAGKVAIPVVEYNWYAHRAMEGYFEEIGRAGAGWTGFDYERPVDSGGAKVPFKDLPPLPERRRAQAGRDVDQHHVFPEGGDSRGREGGRATRAPSQRSARADQPGIGQIMGTVEGWKRLIAIVNSPSNGITFDCGVTREMGADPVEVCRYFASRDRINHVHYRNVKVQKPYERYTEVFIDEGLNNMFSVMKELVKHKYARLLYPEHSRGLDYDRERPNFRPQYPGGGGYAAFAYNVGYARAMMQAALT